MNRDGIAEKPIIIELLGSAGSGKSTFVKEALRYSNRFENTEMAAFRGLLHHPAINVPAKSILRLLPIRLAYRLRLTKLTDLYIEQILKLEEIQSYSDFLEYVLDTVNNLDDTTQADKHWLIRRVQSAVAQHLLIRQPVNTNKIVLADEFFLQKNFMLNLKSNHNVNKNNFYHHLDLSPLPHTIIFFNIDTNVCLQRIKSRKNGQSNYNALLKKEMKQRLEISNIYCEKTLEYVSANIHNIINLNSKTNYQRVFKTLLKK